MQQAWHIFKKDLFYLRFETANYLVAIMAAGWLAAYSSGVAEDLVAFTGAYLIAQLIHADAPAGDRQFWITRPYRWTSLLGAKLLFILIVVGLPVFLAQWIILIHEAFPFSAVWRGLLWEQFLLFFAIYLPVAALAAITTGMVPFLSFALGAVLIDIGISFGMYHPEHSLRALEWIRSSIGFVTLLAASVILVCLQYRSRRTNRSRLIGFSILSCGAITYIFIPWSLAWAIQERFSLHPVDTSALTFALDSDTGKFGLAMSRKTRVPISIPFVVHGLSPGKVIPESLQIAIQASGGRDASLKPITFSTPNVSPDNSSDLILHGTGELDRRFFDAERGHPVTLRGSLFLTVFGNRKVHTIYRHWLDNSVDLTATLRCYIGPQGMACVSPFRRTNQWVSVTTGASTEVALYFGMSYSPFPAELRFFPFERYWTPPPVAGGPDAPSPVPDVIVDLAEPVAYVRRDFEIRDVHLLDIALPWRSQRVLRDGKSLVENRLLTRTARHNPKSDIN